ncbi:MAG: S8 family serine peptidase [Planctomycetes bacterium]|nr:S8 family serine peptidase [Planctomycetota bacterium]
MRVLWSSCVAVLAVLAVLCPLLCGQAPAVLPAPAPLAAPDVLHVRLAAGLEVAMATDGAPELHAATPQRAALAGLLAAAASVAPLFPAPAATLDRWHRVAVARVGEARAPDHLGRWLRVTARPGDGPRLAAALRAHPAVLDAFAEPLPVLQDRAAAPLSVARAGGDIPPPTPDFTPLQATLLGPQPLGFDVRPTWGIVGGRGRGVTFHHVEEDWYFGHEDLSKLTRSVAVTPLPGSTPENRNHGSGVIGVVLADRNAFGLNGLADEAALTVASLSGGGGLPGALAAVLIRAVPGDVIGVVFGFDIRQLKPRDLVPMEYFPSYFAAIRTAALLGITVVEAAANGDSDLDDPRFGGRFDRSAQDSLAIMVGATAGPRLAKAAESNWGGRVDVNGWGLAVPSAGTGLLFLPGGDFLQSYTDNFGGTSAATAIVAALAADLIGAIREQDGRLPTPAEVRDLLARHGTPALGAIGRRPDLGAALRAAGLPDGLWVDDLEVAPGAVAGVALRGPAAGQAFVLIAPGTGRLALGFNRDLLLDPLSVVPLTAVPLDPGGAARVVLPLPADPALRGLELYLQAVTIDPIGGPPRLTSSAALLVR